MKRKFTTLLMSISLLASSSLFAIDTWTYTQSSEKLKLMTPATALILLQEGNARFVSGNMKNRNFLQQAKITKKGQHPFAFVLNCMDSRGSPELIFDQGIGDIFAGRVAGNVVNDDQLGGMEYATQVMGAHIVVVMGHTSCGAVKGACEKVTLGNLTQLVNKISPAVNAVQQNTHQVSLNCNDSTTIDMIAKQNVLDMIHEIKNKSPVVKNLVDKNQVMIIGAMHDLFHLIALYRS
jgi:carbonic anhydrase